jgi:hypothetical protein
LLYRRGAGYRATIVPTIGVRRPVDAFNAEAAQRRKTAPKFFKFRFAQNLFWVLPTRHEKHSSIFAFCSP